MGVCGVTVVPQVHVHGCVWCDSCSAGACACVCVVQQLFHRCMSMRVCGTTVVPQVHVHACVWCDSCSAGAADKGTHSNSVYVLVVSSERLLALSHTDIPQLEEGGG